MEEWGQKGTIMRRILFAALLGIFAANNLTAEPRVIRAVVDDWAPFGGEGLPNGGISLDVITAVLSRAGYEVEPHIVPWERAVEGVSTGQYDVIGNLFYLPELEDRITYADPFYESEVRFIQRVGAGHSYTDLDSLRPYSIAVGAGYFYEDEFDEADYLNKREVTTVVQGMRMVAGGRVDLTLDSVDVLNHLLATEVSELATELEVLPLALAVQEIHMAVRNDLDVRDELIQQFNTTLAEMRADGSLDELLAKHR